MSGDLRRCWATSSRFVDSNGRTTSVNITENLSQQSYDLITYPGFNQATRNVTVNYAPLANALVAKKGLKTYKCLFPELLGAQGSVRFVAEVETSGFQLILKDILVYPTETGGRLQAGAGQILQAAKGFLQEARQDGFTSVRFIGDRSLAEGSANPGRVVDFTRTLK
jgi:hypothetical protein